MLFRDKEALKNIEMIHWAADKVWGENCVFGQLKDLDYPFSAFELPLKLYGKIDILLEYEKSMLNYNFLMPNGYTRLYYLNDEPIYRFFDVFIHPDNIKHNFEVLDRVAKRLMDGSLGGTFGDELSRED